MKIPKLHPGLGCLLGSLVYGAITGGLSYLMPAHTNRLLMTAIITAVVMLGGFVERRVATRLGRNPDEIGDWLRGDPKDI